MSSTRTSPSTSTYTLNFPCKAFHHTPYVYVCTYLPINLQQWPHTRLQVNHIHRRGLACWLSSPTETMQEVLCRNTGSLPQHNPLTSSVLDEQGLTAWKETSLNYLTWLRLQTPVLLVESKYPFQCVPSPWNFIQTAPWLTGIIASSSWKGIWSIIILYSSLIFKYVHTYVI